MTPTDKQALAIAWGATVIGLWVWKESAIPRTTESARLRALFDTIEAVGIVATFAGAELIGNRK